MSEKHYMKMADAFVHDDVASLEQHIYAGYMSKHACEYAAHAINSHDELVAENERLVSALYEVERVLSEMQKNGVFVYGLDDLIDEVVCAIQSRSE